MTYADHVAGKATFYKLLTIPPKQKKIENDRDMYSSNLWAQLVDNIGLTLHNGVKTQNNLGKNEKTRFSKAHSVQVLIHIF